MMKKVLSLIICLLIFTSTNFSKVVYSAELYEIESNNDFSTANIVALGDITQGQILAANDYDFFKLQISYPQETNILLSNIPSGCDFDLYIYDSNGSSMASSTKGSNADDSVTQTLNVGTYYIKVLRYSGSSSSFYKLSTLPIGTTPTIPSPDGNIYESEANNDFSNSNSIIFGSTIKGQILTSTDYDCFKLQLLYPRDTNILLNNIPSGCDFDLSLYDSNGFKVDSSINRSNVDESITKTLAAGTYYIRIASATGNSDIYYNLSTSQTPPLAPSADGFVYENEANDDFSAANAIPFGSTVKGNIAASSNVDYFKLQLSSTENIKILLSNISTGCDYDLVLFDFNNNYIASSKKGSNVDESITHSLAAGIYYIKISSYSGSSNNYYSLSTTLAGNAPMAPYPDGGLYEREPNDSSSTAYPIEVGNSIKGQITSTSDNDLFKFQTYSTESLKIGLSDVPDDCNFDLYLYDSNMNRIDSSTNGFGTVESIYKSLPAGTYYIKIISTLRSSTEYYNLSITDVIPPTSTFHGGDIYEFDDSFSLATDMGEGSFTISEPNLNVSNDMDYFKFNLIQRSDVRVVLTNPNYSSAKYRFDLYNSSYGNISYAYNVSEYTITLEPGTYYIKVHDNTAAPYTGLNYQLQMTATGL
ncbi:pre-peptidase C-terminal domain-containing protein [Clostridium cellulovorans]|uniref:Peptidase domain protein n=1 Tax=Clostridium cellulovorans (strain ATCC 35296 / DSM 3052 / OCM 3 / 743B) TaxID=573061 RepID=D9SNQ8_CLOC7|nr:pre-peptidase C-terminal domain-containing protein [Clostridium cellulovorans]ADL49929.1 peptidase domain protein [Clostridium cellulovorans 743B]